MARTSLRTNLRRAGFTLIEMLVVLAIIAVLVSLTAVAVFKTMGRQQFADTKSELSRAEAVFRKAYRATADKYAKEAIPTNSAGQQPIYNTIYAMAGNDSGRAQVIWTKLRLRRAFPMTFNEAVNPNDGNPAPPLSYYINKLGALGYTAATANPNPAANSPESSVCLLLALQRGEDGPGLQPSDIGPTSFFKDLPVTMKGGAAGQPITALVDGVGTPLFFVRWPIYLTAARYNLTGQPVAGFNDADDPTGLLASPLWQSSAGYTSFTTTVHGLAPHPNGAPQTYRNFPIIASAGPNKLLGFNPYAITLTGSPVGNIDADDLLATLAPPQ